MAFANHQFFAYPVFLQAFQIVSSFHIPLQNATEWELSEALFVPSCNKRLSLLVIAAQRQLNMQHTECLK